MGVTEMRQETNEANEDVESLLKRQQQVIEEMRETIEDQRETIEALETRLETQRLSTPLTRRSALKAGGLLALLGLGAGTATAAEPTGQVGAPDRPLEVLRTGALDGPLTGGDRLDDIAGTGLTVEGGTLTVKEELLVNKSILTWHDLDEVRNDPDADYVLLNDLDEETEGYDEVASPSVNGGAGFEPIGELGDGFTGTFDGLGNEIKGLTTERPDATADGENGENAGLFGAVGEGGELTDVRLVDPTVKAGDGADNNGDDAGDGGGAGALVFHNAGKVNNATVTGATVAAGDGGDDTSEGSVSGVEGGDGGSVGALVGENEGEITDGTVADSTLTAGTGGDAANGGSDGNAGGILGENSGTGTLTNVSSETDVDVSVDRRIGVGGVVGFNDGGTVKEAHATGNVSGDGRVGGVVGVNLGGTVTESHATGSVSGGEAGGVVGSNSRGTVKKSYATGDVTGVGFAGAGGLVGSNSGTVTESYATGSVSGNEGVGGVVGSNSGTVEESYATGDATGDRSIGGLAGNNENGTVKRSYATGVVSGNSEVGGFVGSNKRGTVEGSYWDTEATGQGDGAGIGNKDGMTGLKTDQMQGDSPSPPEDNMSAFDFSNVWDTVTDDYPVLRALDRETQLGVR